MSHNPFSTSLFVSPLPSSGTGPGGHRKHFRTSSPPSSDYVFPPSNRPRTISSHRSSGVHPIPIPCRRRSDVDFGTPESPFSPTLFDYYHHRRPTSSLRAPVGVEMKDETPITPVMTPREELDIPFFPFETISLHSSSSSSTHGSSDGSFDVSIESSDPPMGFDPNLRRRSLAGPPIYRQAKPPMEVSTESVGSFPTEIPETKTMRRLPSGGVVSGWGIDALDTSDRRSTRSSSSGTPVGSMMASSPCGDKKPWLKETKASLSLASVEKATVIASPQTSPIGVNRRCSIPLPVLDTQSTPPTRRFSLPPRPHLRTHKSDLSASSSSSSAGGLGLGSNRLTERRTSSLGLIGVELPPCIEGDPTSIVQAPASSPFSPRTSDLPTVVSPPSPPSTPIIRANGGISSSVKGGGGDGRPSEIKGYRRGSSCLELPSSPMQTYSPTPTSLSRPLPSVSSNQFPYSPSFSPSSASASSPSTTSSSPSSSSRRVDVSQIEIFYDPESPIAPLCRKLLLSLHRRSTVSSTHALTRVGSTILDGSGFGTEAGGARPKPKVRLTLGGGSSRGRVGGADRMVVEEFDPTGMSLDEVLERIDRSVVVDC